MDVRRGKLPENVSRTVEIDISREEMLAILSSFLKIRLKSVDFKIDIVKGITADNASDSQGVIAPLEGMTISGEEIVPVPWPSNSANGINPASNPFAIGNVDKKAIPAKPVDAKV